MLRDVLSLDGTGQKFGKDLDARIAVDLGGTCMNSGLLWCVAEAVSKLAVSEAKRDV